MKIALVTSCLAPDRDGVGDYARALASACVSLGHSCWLLALNDRHVDRPMREQQIARTQMLDTLRLPQSYRWSERFGIARNWLDERRPDWISLQLVAYGFHPKGMIGRLRGRLASLLRGYRLHVMLHELWIGMERGTPIRRRVVGRLQRAAILALLDELAPSRLHTTIIAYERALGRYGVRADLLPLFGNVPVVADPETRWLDAELARLGVPLEYAGCRERSWRFGLFGSIYPTWSSEPLFRLLEEAAHRAERQAIIASIGRRGAGERNWQSIQRRYAGRFCFAGLGERSAHEISTFLQSIDFGIAITPWQLIGKSGTAAAMSEHGLPVIVAGADQDFGVDSRCPQTPMLRGVDNGLPDWLSDVRPSAPRERVADIAQQFLVELGAP